ncbi:MAG: hypothetical protein IPI01_19070 [Ignavibacteriae bacterium]|nr:hypothetical protein [Ignavibacteriota bacterium]
MRNAASICTGTDSRRRSSASETPVRRARIFRVSERTLSRDSIRSFIWRTSEARVSETYFEIVLPMTGYRASIMASRSPRTVSLIAELTSGARSAEA